MDLKGLISKIVNDPDYTKNESHILGQWGCEMDRMATAFDDSSDKELLSAEKGFAKAYQAAAKCFLDARKVPANVDGRFWMNELGTFLSRLDFALSDYEEKIAHGGRLTMEMKALVTASVLLIGDIKYRIKLLDDFLDTKKWKQRRSLRD